MLLGLDIGTTSIKSVLYDPSIGQVVRSAVRPTPVHQPRDGWSEHDPQALWQAAADCIRESSGSQAVEGLAISTMAEAGLMIDRHGQSLASAIAWYDRRSEPQAAWIETKISQSDLYRITGQRVSPSFGLTKMLWEREHLPELFSQAAMWLPLPAYLIYQLTGQTAVDYTIAARTLLFDQRSLQWSQELLQTFDFPVSFLPAVQRGGSPVGTLSASAARATGLQRGTPCFLGGHDHLCAALAAGGHKSGAVIDSTGSANALLMLLPHFLPDPALAERGFASYAYLLGGLYALKGGLKSAGSALEWLARLLSSDGKTPNYLALEAEAQEGAGRRAGPLWLPHLIGSGTPHGDRFSRAAAAGLRFEHRQADLFRGMLESLAFWTRQNLEEMTAYTGQSLETLTLIGGATRLHLLSALKADVLNLPVHIPRIPEAAATGAALLAGLGSGIFRDPLEAVESLRYDCEVIAPNLRRAEWYDVMYHSAYLPLYEALKTVHHALESMDKQPLGGDTK